MMCETFARNMTVLNVPSTTNEAKRVEVTNVLARDRRTVLTGVKEILRDYGHQDLLWGKQSWKEVFEHILKGLS